MKPTTRPAIRPSDALNSRLRSSRTCSISVIEPSAARWNLLGPRRRRRATANAPGGVSCRGRAGPGRPPGRRDRSGDLSAAAAGARPGRPPSPRRRCRREALGLRLDDPQRPAQRARRVRQPLRAEQQDEHHHEMMMCHGLRAPMGLQLGRIMDSSVCVGPSYVCFLVTAPAEPVRRGQARERSGVGTVTESLTTVDRGAVVCLGPRPRRPPARIVRRSSRRARLRPAAPRPACSALQPRQRPGAARPAGRSTRHDGRQQHHHGQHDGRDPDPHHHARHLSRPRRRRTRPGRRRPAPRIRSTSSAGATTVTSGPRPSTQPPRPAEVGDPHA